MDLSELTEGCLSHILSLTSPIDVVRSSAVSKQFLSAADSDAVWKNLLPRDCDQIISQLSPPIEFRSKKDLFFLLCRSHLLFGDNTMSFSLDKRTGKKCYMLGAKALSIAWGDTPAYWTWRSIHDSRFPMVAELRSVCWLEIKGKIHTKLLTSSTTYGAYFVFKMIVNNNHGFEDTPVKVSMLEYDEDSLPSNHLHDVVVKHFCLEALESEEDMGRRRRHRRRCELGRPSEREDGWMEIEMGRYQVGVNGHNERVILEMSLRETEILNWKHGLLVNGIELRPLD